MKKALIGTALASGLLLATPATFAGTGYIGIDYQLYNTVVEELDDFKPEAIALKLGGNLNDYFQVEGRIGSSIADDSANESALQIDNIFGFYLKGGVDLMDLLFPYVVVGYTKADFQFVGEPSQTESDLSYGVGADVHFGSFQVGAEWMMAQDKTDYELKLMSVSAAWRF